MIFMMASNEIREVVWICAFVMLFKCFLFFQNLTVWKGDLLMATPNLAIKKASFIDLEYVIDPFSWFKNLSLKSACCD